MKVRKWYALFLCLVLVLFVYGCQAVTNQTDEYESVSSELEQYEPDSYEANQDESDLNETDSDEIDLVEAYLQETDLDEMEIFEIDISGFNQFHLTILHTNDWHGVLHNVPMYSTLVQEIRAERENVLLLDGGDIYRRGPFEELHGTAEIAVMNAMGYDALVFGNNDFPRNDEELFHVSQHTILQQAEFPVLCANVTLDGEFVEGFEPFIIATMQDINIAIIGVTSPKPWDRNFDFTQRYLFECPLIVVERLTEETSEISDIQIVLSHAGFDLERQMSGVSAVIGGDDHRILRAPYVINDGDRRVPVVQAGGENNHFLGRLDLHFVEIDEAWILHDFYGSLLSVEDVTPDPEIQSIINYYRAMLGLEIEYPDND